MLKAGVSDDVGDETKIVEGVGEGKGWPDGEKVLVIPWEKIALRIKTRTAMMEKVKITGEL